MEYCFDRNIDKVKAVLLVPGIDISRSCEGWMENREYKIDEKDQEDKQGTTLDVILYFVVIRWGNPILGIPYSRNSRMTLLFLDHLLIQSDKQTEYSLKIKFPIFVC